MTPVDESIKIHYFKDGITDPSFSSVKRTIMVDRQKFQDFDTVLQSSAHRNLRTLPFKCTMFLPSKVVMAVDKR
jgi:hypothetical protein